MPVLQLLDELAQVDLEHRLVLDYEQFRNGLHPDGRRPHSPQDALRAVAGHKEARGLVRYWGWADADLRELLDGAERCDPTSESLRDRAYYLRKQIRRLQRSIEAGAQGDADLTAQVERFSERFNAYLAKLPPEERGEDAPLLTPEGQQQFVEASHRLAAQHELVKANAGMLHQASVAFLEQAAAVLQLEAELDELGG